MKTSSAGFSLMELIITIVILGILTSMAIPTYNKAVEKSRASEAFVNLEIINMAQKIRRVDTGKFASGPIKGVTKINAELSTEMEDEFYDFELLKAKGKASDKYQATATRKNLGALDFNPNNVVGGQVHNFTYALSGVATEAFTLTATKSAAPFLNTTVVINQQSSLCGTLSDLPAC